MGEKDEKNRRSFQRRKTAKVMIGNVPVGSDYPVRIQSMTSTRTMDTKATVEQSIKIIRAGGEIVRITTPTLKDAENLANIKEELIKHGYNQPLVADIHFNPAVAFKAASLVEKIRINPGNFVDRKNFDQIGYSDEEYRAEVERLKEKFIPLLDECRKHHTALRIGTNHGSLSDRILSRYGDTPEGMAESAMEFLRICKQQSFDQVVLSMKASNTRIMVEATRLLVKKMEQENMYFPLHLGVTEAGEGEDGRIKSAVGIGALMAEGIGDTIRVSLTEDPEKEIPVARKLVEYYEKKEGESQVLFAESIPFDPYSYTRRKSYELKNIGGSKVPVVIAETDYQEEDLSAQLNSVGWHWHPGENAWKFDDQAADYIYLHEIPDNYPLPDNRGIIFSWQNWQRITDPPHNCYPLLSQEEYMNTPAFTNRLKFLEVTDNRISDPVIDRIIKDRETVLVVKALHPKGFAGHHHVFMKLMKAGCDVPVIIKKVYQEKDSESFQLQSAADTGGLFLDGLGEGLWLKNKGLDIRQVNVTAFGILQASRVRITKTEFISCPSCGRTLFDLQETTAKIRKKTAHLKGLKIGIMGCIVNGPGEMADSDYGYVGAGPGKITLYKEKTVVKRNIPESNAVEELVQLIKENGDWIEPG